MTTERRAAVHAAKQAKAMTKKQHEALVSIVARPRFPCRRYHRTFMALVSHGFAEPIFRHRDAGDIDVGFKITASGLSRVMAANG